MSKEPKPIALGRLMALGADVQACALAGRYRDAYGLVCELAQAAGAELSGQWGDLGVACAASHDEDSLHIGVSVRLNIVGPDLSLGPFVLEVAYADFERWARRLGGQEP